ncbi:helix-turn-helix domain-containing protein [Solihabitans fulvus]|uniref:Helix-turn-helix domain-containing protein n=1 Tax=Solihabitans fulvus TaxID=1892852 RepID=A0A5B2WQL4_9PSEU|nr:helix-turn-helix transcriptional regulator [Solihabitans fulvus]KAA2254283.1 helix-turn-helix domain-containing protein [Solihabitans fulvus]
MSRQDSPTVQHWQLARMLRQLRDDAGFTLDQAVDLLKQRAPKSHAWSKSKLHRIETREAKRMKPVEIDLIAQVCGADRQLRELLVDMARKANQKGWWVKYQLPGETQPLVGLEQGALMIRQFEPLLVPGLVQTSDYSRSLMRSGEPTSPDVLENRVAARMVRQHILEGEEALQYHVILDEAVLRRSVSPRRVMRGQLERLLELEKQRNVTLQVLPFKAGLHPGMEGPFTLLTLPEPVRDIVYFEGPPGSFYLEELDQIRRCTLRFGMLTTAALDPGESINLIASVLSEYA